MNKVIISGNVTKDCELRTTPDGVNVCTFTVAVNDKYNKKKEAQFFRVTAWRMLAETCAKYIVKGMKVGVIGPVELSKFTDKREGVERCTLSVTADEVEFLNRPNQNNSYSDSYDGAPEVPDNSTGFTAVETDELPF